MEILDLYDKDRNLTRKTIERTKEAKLNDDEYFLYVQCWIINKDKQILLTRRKLDKVNGGKWEPTGGCVSAGETSKQGIQRELEEEIGVKAELDEFKLIKTIITEEKYRNCFRDIYVLEKDVNLNDLRFNDDEVMDAKYVTIEEFHQMLEEGNALFKWLKFFEEEYYKLI